MTELYVKSVVKHMCACLILALISAQALAVLRIVGGALALLLIARMTGRRWPRTPGIYGRLALYSIFGVILNQVLFIEGLSRTTPSHSSLIMTTIPVATLMIAVLFGRERLTRNKMIAPLLAVAGVVLIIRPDGALFQSATALGDLLTLANGLSFSLFLVLSKPLLARTDALASTAVLMSFGALGIAAIGGPELLAADLSAVSGLTWTLLAYIIVGPTALAYWLQYWALARTDSSVVAFFIYLQPIIATSLSVVLLGDRPGLPALLGGGLIFLGVYLTTRRRTAPAPTTPL